MAKLFAVLTAYHINGSVISIRNEPLVSVHGGFMRESGESEEWKFEGITHPWEVDRIMVNFLGMPTRLVIEDMEDDGPGEVSVTLPPLLLKIYGSEDDEILP